MNQSPTEPTPGAPAKYQVPSVESACRILRAVCEAGSPVPMAELHRLSETSRTTAMRIVSSLCNNGFLHREPDGRLSVGNVMNLLGSRIQGASDLRQRAVPILRELAETIGETAHLALPLETQCLLQEVVDSPQLVRVASRPGTLIDYHCSSTGKSILAFRNDILRHLRETTKPSKRTENTITTWHDLEAELELVRHRGYAVDEEEYHRGVRCVGAPVRDLSGKVVAAIGVTGTNTSLTKRRVPTIAKLLIAATDKLSQNH